MSQSEAAAGATEILDRPRRHWGRFVVLLVACLFGLSLAVWAGYRGFLRFRAQRELDEAMAALDRTDPGWRLEELEASRKPVPDDRNAALAVMRVRALLPKDWPAVDFAARPQRQLAPAQTDSLRASLKTAGEALALAASLADYTEGRFPAAEDSDPLSASPHCTDAQEVAQLLRLQAKLLTQDNDGEGAIAAARCVLAAARAIGDEPNLLAQLTRMRCQTDAFVATQRILGQTQPSEALLSKLQHEMEEESNAPLLLFVARGERAAYHQLAVAAENGATELSKVLLRVTPEPGLWGTQLFAPPPATVVRTAHARMLDYLSGLVELARLPNSEQGPATLEFSSRRSAIIDGHELFTGLDQRERNLPIVFRREQAMLRCAVVALAAERFRRAKKRWPAKMEELQPTYLATAVLDPFGGGPLRLELENDGLSISSQGRDLASGRRAGPQPPSDVGVRLWDVDARRQAARPEDTGARRPPGLRR